MQIMKSEIFELLKSKFPPLLSEIPDPPKKLYYRGVLPDWKKFKFLCVVGSRKYSNYGKEATERLIEGLRGYPVVIVSGLALGIDSIAHEAALRAKLITIAIPGSGLNSDVLYPASHRRLAEKIITAGGALMSEFEPDFRATTWSFPQRNRIMAGISHATLVIEAEIKSGTLITSRLATDYNRDVLTVPGSIFSKQSEGPHMLLRLGATPATGSDVILDTLGFKKEESGGVSGKSYDDCSPEEKKIIALLTSPFSREDLIAESALPVHELNALLSLLELKGHIKETGGEIHLI